MVAEERAWLQRNFDEVVAMRFSCRPGDAAYDAIALEDKSLHIFLDGRDICMICHTADEELGEAHVYKLNGEGKKYYDPDTDDAAQEIRRGNVHILRAPTADHISAEHWYQR